MAAKGNIFNRVRFVRRHSSLLLKCAVLAVVVLSALTLTSLSIGIHQNRQRAEALRSQAAQLERENETLAEHISQLGTVQSVKRIAAEALGLVDPGTVVFGAENN